jgi:transcriptional regulator with XRE-family HTH domain
MNFGKHIKAARERHSISQKDAAHGLGITTVYLCNLEKGKSVPSLDLIEKIHKVFGVNVYISAWREYQKAKDQP